MRIPDEKIEEIRAASDVLDVVSEHVQLKRRGSNYFGLCPFHAEKTPSFSVNPALGIYKCFGCGRAGDVFQFVMAVEGSSFIEAVRLLADRAGISLPEDDAADEEATVAGSILHALRWSARYYYRRLAGAEGANARAYLQERGFGADVIKRFGLGYAPDSWDALSTAATDDRLSGDVLVQAGLVIPRKGSDGFYDRFRNRLMFPIISHMGRVVGFGGRLLTSDEKQPKYVNSPETPVYQKSRVLYGLYQARQAVRQEGEVILVEGYTDVMALHQAGVEHVVASSGTALSVDQVKLLKRYAQRVVLLYDADAAGAAASLRGMERVLEAGMAAYAIALPEGHDPDSFVREHGGDAFRSYVDAHSEDFVAFQFALAERSGALKTPEGQAESVGRLVDLIAVVPDPIAQESYLQRAREVTGMPLTTLWRALEQRSQVRVRNRASNDAMQKPSGPPSRTAPPAKAAPRGGPAEVRPVLPAEEALLRLMLEHGTNMIEFVLGHTSISEFSAGAPRRAAQELLDRYEAGKFEVRALLEESGDAELRSFLAGIMTDRDVPSLNWERRNIPVPRLNEDAMNAAAGAMTQLKLYHVDREIERIREATFEEQEKGGDLAELQRKRMALHTLRKQIERREFINWPETAKGR